jgi:hypothetical protein
MRPDTNSAARGQKPTGHISGLYWLLLAGFAISSTGCEEEPRVTAGKDRVSSKPREDSGPIIGQRTQKVVEAEAALKKGDARVASTKIVAKDPITLQGNAYVAIIGRTSQLQIEHALNLFRGANDRFPKDYDEFMAEIIKANNISLPKLPAYQEYAYDEKEHKLIVIEYPDRK